MDRARQFDFSSATEASVRRIVYSLRDFEYAGHGLALLLDSVDYSSEYVRDELVKFACYETAAIVSFCRPLSRSNDNTRLSLSDIGLTASNDEEILMQKIRRFRNKIFAHSDTDEMHYRVDLIDPQIEGLNLPFPHIQFEHSLRLSEEQACCMADLIQCFCHQINRYIIQLGRVRPDLVEKYVRPIDS